MGFWLDNIVRRSGIPYPLFFVLIALILYLSGIPLMIETDNLQTFFTDYRWILISVFGAYNGILIIFIYRKFSDSFDNIEHLIDSDDFNRMKEKLLGRLTSKFSWIVVVFWIIINSSFLNEDIQRWFLRSLYNKPHIVTAYYFIETSTIIFVGIFHYMILLGLNLAYRDLCLRTPFKKEALISEWMEPFKGFKKLITLIMFGAVVYAVLPPNIYGSMHVLLVIPYTAPTIILLSAILSPHYYFHALFSKIKEGRLRHLQRDLSQIPDRKMEDVVRRMYLFLEEGRVEKMKTWLIDVKVLGEILIVALMHVILVEALTTIVHG